MKRIIRVEDLIVAFISCLGYGVGYALPKMWGHSTVVCLLSCLVLGVMMDAIGNRLIKTNWARRSTVNKILTGIATVVVFVVIACLSPKMLEETLWEYLEEQILIYSIGFSVAGYLLSLSMHGIKSYVVQRRYKDGSAGHTMSEEEIRLMESLKGENHEITGDYDKSLAVKTENGIFVAKKSKKVLEYLGIPYAKPPVGNLRWKAPQKAEPSEKVWEAYFFGASAMQEDKGSFSLKTHTQSEDCLTLNVWKAVDKKKEGGLRPVILYVHGGNFAFGGSAEPLYHGRSFVQDFPDIIVVSFNYRLGIFGFADFSEIPGGEAYGDSRNLGLMDQIMALNWVHDNIRSFGGDPDNIMLAGDNAGAYSIHILSTLKEANGLFKKALLISCNNSRLWSDELSVWITRDIKREFAAETMDEMLRIPAEDLKNLVDKNMDLYGFMPAVDGRLIRKNAEQAIKEGASGDIRFIYGIPADETSSWMMVGDEENMYKWLEDSCKELLEINKGTENEGKLEKMIEVYEKKGFAEKEARRKALECWIYRCTPLMNCMNLSDLGKTVRCFFWDVKSPVEKYGGSSISAVGALLGNGSSAENLGHVVDSTIRKVFQRLVYNELVKNRPELGYDEVKGVDALEWRPFEADKTPILHVMNRDMKLEEGLLATEIKLSQL